MAQHFDLEEQEQLDQLKHFWSKWGTPITGALIVVFGSFAAWNGYQYWQARQSTQAAALADAVTQAVEGQQLDRIGQALTDLKSDYAGTQQAAQAGLLAAKAYADAGQWDQAKETLTWVADKGSDNGLQSLARLRLATVLIEQKQPDDALKQLSASFPAEFTAVAADRRGDAYAQQDKKTEAVAEYEKAYKAFDSQIDYRRLVEFKLNALGVQVQPQNSSTEAKL